MLFRSVRAAALLKQTFRGSDIVARLGGDEFVVLAADAAQESVTLMTARLQRRFEEYNSQGKHPYQLSVSVGVAVADPLRPPSLEALMNKADQHLYEQKRVRKEFSSQRERTGGGG